jgi:glycosyltransferase involved in cell wall biosynthesis
LGENWRRLSGANLDELHISLKKIIHIIVGLDVGGAELMLKRLIESHHDRVHTEHSVISLTDCGTVGLQLRAQGVEVTTLGMRSAFGTIRTVWRLARIIRAARPDIVQTWMYHADLLGGVAARLAGHKNIIWGIRTTEVDSGPRATAVVRRACALLSRWVPHTIVCAAQASRRAHLRIGYDAARMVVVPNGFDMARLSATQDEREALRRSCGIAPDAVVIGTLGRFNPDKDQGSFVRAAGVLARQYPTLRFLMVGRDLDAANGELATWIAATGHADRFVLLGQRADAAACLRAMDIFCLSSRTEGFPNVVGEAMALAVPCAVTDVGDAAMLVADTGIVVPKEDAARLADALAQLLELGLAGRQQLGERARARVRAEFSIERARDRFDELYKNILGKGLR